MDSAFLQVYHVSVKVKINRASLLLPQVNRIQILSDLGVTKSKDGLFSTSKDFGIVYLLIEEVSYSAY